MIFGGATVLAAVSVNMFIHYLGNFADVIALPESDDSPWLLRTVKSTLHVYSATCRSGYLSLAEVKGWVTETEMDLQRLESSCEAQMNVWEYRMLGEEIDRHVNMKRITTTELKFLIADLASVATDETVEATTVEVLLPCSVETADQFMKLQVTPDTPSDVDANSTPHLSKTPRRRVVDVLNATASAHAVGMRPADVKQVADALRSTDDDAEEQTQQQPPLQLEFQVSEQVEWYLGDEGHEKLQSSQELSEWLAYHRLQHCAAQPEKHGIDMDVLRIAADDEDLRVGAFTDLGERDEHLMLQAIENPA